MGNLWNGNHIPVGVEQGDIDASVQRSSSCCMIASAIRREIPGAWRIFVDTQSIRFSIKDGTRYVCLTPRPCQAVIVAFDQGQYELLRPFVLNLRPVQITRPAPRRTETATQRFTESGERNLDVDRADGLVVPPPPKRKYVRSKAPPVKREFGLRMLQR